MLEGGEVALDLIGQNKMTHCPDSMTKEQGESWRRPAGKIVMTRRAMRRARGTSPVVQCMPPIAHMRCTLTMTQTIVAMRRATPVPWGGRPAKSILDRYRWSLNLSLSCRSNVPGPLLADANVLPLTHVSRSLTSTPTPPPTFFGRPAPPALPPPPPCRARWQSRARNATRIAMSWLWKSLQLQWCTTSMLLCMGGMIPPQLQ